MDDIWRVVAPGAVAFVVWYLGFHLQHGGRRGRLRKEIQEEFDLIERLEADDRFGAGPWTEASRLRLRNLLVRYKKLLRAEAGRDGVTAPGLKWRDMLAIGATALVGIGLVLEGAPDLSWVGSLSVGALVGTLAAAAAALITSRRERIAAEDEERKAWDALNRFAATNPEWADVPPPDEVTDPPLPEN